MRMPLLVLTLALTCPAFAKPPEVLDPDFQLTKFAGEPDLVTPVGICFDKKGRLLVIESHTHFTPKDYAGPKNDRIRIVEDTDGDGQADRFRTFYEGSTHTMSIAAHGDGSIYIATRRRIFRLRDTDNDDKADKEEPLVELKTKGTYPHNGLCGLAFDNHGGFFFGLGENLGVDYTLVGSDGKALRGGGEGGNIYHVTADGKNLKRIATGLWNPFGICVDAHDRIFTVENDPDGRPPCRLLHVVPGGDFGFQFRYGRPGTHPLQAWDGELPGTLPMMAGTGEAPCTVLPYRGSLFVTSWGDFRIERYDPTPKGSSWKAKQTIVVRGDNHFRPVGMAVAPDGSLYFSDWVERSYPVHGKGRLWKLTPKKSAKLRRYPALSPDEKRLRAVQAKPNAQALDSTDPFLFQAAVWGWIEHGKPAELSWPKLTPRQRLGVLLALRWKNEAPDSILPKALDDPDSDVRLVAIRWIADENLTKYRDQIRRQLQRPGSRALHRAALTALPWLERKDSLARKDNASKFFLGILDDKSLALEVRAFALTSLPADHAALTPDKLRPLLESDNATLRREALWSLILSNKPNRLPLLRAIADSSDSPASIRADAVLGIALLGNSSKPTLEKYAKIGDPASKEQAQRSLRDKDLTEKRPALNDMQAWEKLLAPEGDADVGRRIFFGTNVGQCSNCHAHQGRGATIGPDLTHLHRQPKSSIIASILQPSQEVAPHFQTWLIETKKGQVLTGYAIGKTNNGDSERLVDAQGKTWTIPLRDIETKQAVSKSIMPDNLTNRLTLDELRALLTFLTRSN